MNSPISAYDAFLIRYMNNNYITGTYEPRLCNVHNRENDTRTNNYAEGFHNKWNNLIARHHPNLWFFVRALKDEQKTTEVGSAAAYRGDAPPIKRLKWRNLERRRRRLKEQYLSGSRTLKDYWGAIGHF